MTDIRIALDRDVKNLLPVDNVDTSNGTWNFASLQVGGAAVATQAYADTLKAGMAPKGECVAASTSTDGNIVLSGLARVLDTVDIDTDGMRVFLAYQTDASENGPWVAHAGAWTRPTDFDEDADALNGALFPISSLGVEAAAGRRFFLLTNNDPVIGTDDLVFTVFPAGSANAGTGGEISEINAGDAPSAGSSANYAPADHEHGVATAAPADLSESTSSSGEGSSTSLARADHSHAFPNLGKEGASSLLANIRRRDAELHVTPGSIGSVVEASGVVGLAVTPEGSPAMSVRVAMGTAYGSGYVRANVPAGNQQVTLSAADATFPRYDAIVLTEGGSLTKREGTPGGSPSAPSLSSGDTLLAYVYVAANETTITETEIFNQRLCANPRSRTESFTANGSTPTFRLARHTYGKPVVYRDGLRMLDVTGNSASTYSEYTVSDPVESNGTIITFGADVPAYAVIVVDYVG